MRQDSFFLSFAEGPAEIHMPPEGLEDGAISDYRC
jgi:hypothetical protein